MTEPYNAERLKNEQYRDSSNLNARIRLHQFSTSKQGWSDWLFDQLDLPPVCRILELGCGPGRFWKPRIDRIPSGWDVTLSDFSEGMVNEAKQNLSDTGRHFGYQVIDAQSIPFPDASFDAVFAFHMLYHVPNLDLAISEIARVLRPGGVLYASTIGNNHMRELWEMVATYAPKVDCLQDDIISNFRLENGGDMLLRVFSDVTQLRYEDSLLVPDARLLVDYVLSTGADASDVVELRKAAEGEIAAEGAIHVAKDTGLFVARK